MKLRRDQLQMVCHTKLAILTALELSFTLLFGVGYFTFLHLHLFTSWLSDRDLETSCDDFFISKWQKSIKREHICVMKLIKTSYFRTPFLIVQRTSLFDNNSCDLHESIVLRMT